MRRNRGSMNVFSIQNNFSLHKNSKLYSMKCFPREIEDPLKPLGMYNIIPTFEGFQGSSQFIPHDAERRKSLGQLCA